MKVLPNGHVVGVDLALFNGGSVDKEEFKQGLGSHHSRVDKAVQDLQRYLAPFKLTQIYVGHSGGKDSVVVRYLADLVFGRGRVISLHTPKIEGPNTVHPLTIDYLYSHSLDYPMLVTRNNPRHYGYVCQIDGTRRAEATREDGRSTDVLIDGVNVPRTEMPMFVERGIMDLSILFPIVDWSDAEVWATIHRADIPYSKEYVMGW